VRVTEGHPSFSSLFNFGLLIIALVYFLRKPIREGLFGRREKIAKAVEESERLRQEVERMLREYEAKLAQLDGEVALLMADAKAEGEKERERIVERARPTAEKIMEDARNAAARETERAKARLQKEVVERAVLEAMTMLRGRIGEKEHQLFTDEFVKGLEKGHGAN
jgi:F-type H+-transporting ATPase subunit b